MMDWTDRHCRYFLRGFSPHILLYTEMITATAILRGDRARLLGFDPEEHPVALQLGGSDPAELATAAEIGEQFGYDEINLNCGCPSDRVASGSFGACLMLQPQRVAACVAAIRARVRIPVTVKMRIGVVQGHGVEVRTAMTRFDDADSAALEDFVLKIRQAGSDAAIVHARKAVLGGLSPKDNREVPPLRFDVVRRLKAAFPDYPLVLNGGVRDARTALEALEWCQGVMLGREAYHRPVVLDELRRALYAGHPDAENIRQHQIERMAAYAERELARGTRLPAITKHMLGLCGSLPGAKEYRRYLSESSRARGANAETIRRAGRMVLDRDATQAVA